LKQRRLNHCAIAQLEVDPHRRAAIRSWRDAITHGESGVSKSAFTSNGGTAGSPTSGGMAAFKDE
jgi:hypothetical protein